MVTGHVDPWGLELHVVPVPEITFLAFRNVFEGDKVVSAHQECQGFFSNGKIGR